MKGIVLAGGLGTRLHPLTKVTNKCLLPVYNKPMIYYPIQHLVDSGINEILLVCGGNASGEFLRILGNGKEFGLKHLHYTYQDEPRGIADALGLARDFIDDDSMCVILADNIYEKNVLEHVSRFDNYPHGAVIFGKRVDNPQHYGVIYTDNDGNINDIVEKPKNPTSNVIATGLYLYDNNVWDYIDSLSPSARGELEITDVNRHYLAVNKLRMVEVDGWWADCGENFDMYLDACIKVRDLHHQK